MDLCIVAQGLKVADALYWGGDGLPITDGAGAEGHLQADRSRIMRCKISSWISPISCTWIWRVCSFQAMWSWGSSSSSWRRLPRAVWGSVPSGSST